MATKFKNAMKSLWQDESAQGMLEYVLLAVAIVTVLVVFKSKLKGWFESTSSNIDNGVNSINSGNQ